MAETIRVRFTPNPGDYGRVMRAHTVRTRTVWLSLAAITILVFLFAWSSLTQSQGRDVLLWVVVIGAPLLATLVVFVWQPMRIRRQVQKQEQFRSDTTWQVDDSQIVIKTSYAETKLDWDTFGQVMETRDDFLLVYASSKRMVQFVPKRAFESPEQEEAFRMLLQRKLRVGKWI
jgi:hypothetical protein